MAVIRDFCRRAALASVLCIGHAAALGTPHFGVTPSADELATHDNLIFPSGQGLPQGMGTVSAGRALFAAKCASCHGADGRGGSGGELAGAERPLTDPQPDKTIGSYWPFATTLFDFIRRAMPLNAPWSLSNTEVYALVAYLLHINHVVPAEFVASALSVPQVEMPNRHGFVSIDSVPLLKK